MKSLEKFRKETLEEITTESCCFDFLKELLDRFLQEPMRDFPRKPTSIAREILKLPLDKFLKYALEEFVKKNHGEISEKVDKNFSRRFPVENSEGSREWKMF